MSAPPERASFDSRTASSVRRMGVLGSLAAVFVFAGVLAGPPVAAVLVFVWAWVSRTPLAEIGLKRPGSWLGVLAIGIAAGVALKLAMKAVVIPYFGGPPMAPIYQHLRGDLSAFLIEVPQMIIFAGLAEEIVFRGFLINRLQALIGTSVASGILIVIVTAGIFGPLHYMTQGYFGALQATMIGVLFASAYLLNGRSLWSLIVAHATFDVVSIYLIYAGLEEQVARSIFP